MNDTKGNGLLWVLVGCGGLMFVGLCVTVGVGVYVLADRGELTLLPSPDGPPPAPQPAPVPPGPPPTSPPLPPPPTVQPPFTLEATVTEVTGSLAGRVQSRCRLAIEEVSSIEGMRCRTQIVCDSILVYGGPQAGYFPCTLDAPRRSVSGSDTQTTGDDGDAAMTIDTASGSLRISDDASSRNGAFTLVARLATTL